MDCAEYTCRCRNYENRVGICLILGVGCDTKSEHLRYISRANPRDNTRHVILSTASLRPADFAAQLNVALANGWGIVRTVTDMCMKMPEGKYVLVKDPNKVSKELDDE